LNNFALPTQQGLYDPTREHDACGVGFVAQMNNVPSHDIVQMGLKILENLAHRGATGADKLAGDGAGILVQMPDAFMRQRCQELNIVLPALGEYAVGQLFVPQDATRRTIVQSKVESFVQFYGQTLLGWRVVPTVGEGLGVSVRRTEPLVMQVFVGCSSGLDLEAFERTLFVIRRRVELALVQEGFSRAEFYVSSFSARTIVYKGMLLADQVAAYYPDLSDPLFVSALALVHQRFSTNTFPTWDLAHPFRYIAHNGEINTLRGNVNWMLARQGNMASELFGSDLKDLWPLIAEGQSDSACFDNALELLLASGYSLVHAMSLLIPEAWAGRITMSEQRRAYYEYHAALMEPWDGPAAVAFTDGRQIGATLDRNGLRPARYLQTRDGLVLMASEMGVLDIPQKDIIKKWRLQPGKMFLLDLTQGRIIDDEEIKAQLSGSHPYGEWLKQTQIKLHDVDQIVPRWEVPHSESLEVRQKIFGMTQEEKKFILGPMIQTGQEAVGSMGDDTPVAVLSKRPKSLYQYFRQLFAQVTNPPIDPIREELVMSLVSFIGPRPNLLNPHDHATSLRVEVEQPVLTPREMGYLHHIDTLTDGQFQSRVLDMTWPLSAGPAGLAARLTALQAEALSALSDGVNILLLSDRGAGRERVPIPALLATAAVHHHLVRQGLRTRTGLVVETGSAREVHHFALLAGYGAEAVFPFLVFETLSHDALPNVTAKGDQAIKSFVKSVSKGLLKVMSKMGISTYQSYCGAQIFEIIGLNHSVVDAYFTGTASQIEGLGIEDLARETLCWYQEAFGSTDPFSDLMIGGEYEYRIGGEDHMWTPESISKLQYATRSGKYSTYQEYAQLINDQAKRQMTLRGLFEVKSTLKAIPLSEVESARSIVKRFATGAMSLGSISQPAHSTLAIAMNRIGGKSNTGEGGEDPMRFIPMENGDSMRSAIKQVASGRFGVTAEYLVNADDIQIKISQGAKPGEGGQLPGHKVSPYIGRLRHSVPGVGLISPPPHHDIYSIEDLAQLIHDLKNVNPSARLSVKLVSEVGVGTVAAGVAKAHADHVTISGHDGGTGASPLSSIKYAGTPWELGLAETQQTLVLNHLRGRICVQADGQMKTGRDVVIGALLGADEFGFATAPLVVEGCIMMRKCHLNTCPVGIATQDPELLKRFNGQPEHVINFFFFVAEEVREYMAMLGFRTFSEMVGRSDCLEMKQGIEHWKTKGLDFSRLFYQPNEPASVARSWSEKQDHGLERALDHVWIQKSQAALEHRTPVQFSTSVRNVHRTLGAMLSGEVARRYGNVGLPEGTIDILAKGTAGQSFGAFLAHGIRLHLQGEANDYVGKGLSGGQIMIRPTEDCPIVAAENIIVGNTVLYGATDGQAFFAGVAGERFAVRNSGAIAVVEGVGDHGCEYMTGGTVVVLGETGQNFAAGMSGGIAYVWDPQQRFKRHCNPSMVDLDPLEDEDFATLKYWIEQHRQWTGSQRASEILKNWVTSRLQFVKVMPQEYRLALTKLKQSNDEAIQEDVVHG